MPLPPKVQVLIVGAGPTGLITAITLVKLGVQVAIVDSSPKNQNGSRASIIHANTLEKLDTIGMAQPLVDSESGIRCDKVLFRGTTNKILEFDLSQLRDVTEFPFSLLIPQHEAERIFRERLASNNIQILCNRTAVGLGQSEDDDGVDVMFDDGNVVKTQYVIGADGSRSTIRRLMGIEFKDPHTGIAYDDNTLQSIHIVLADVYLNDPLPEHIPRNGLSVHLDNLLFLIPLLEKKDSAAKPTRFWRVGYFFSAGRPKPPRNLSLEYLQQVMDTRNPWGTRITIASVDAASCYRVRAAVASTYFQKVGNGNILLVGDAAHAHSPAGGQGMNLGICDAVVAAHAVRSHIMTDAADPEQRDKVLRDYADSRRKIGVKVVGLTRGLTRLINASTGWRRILRNFILRAVSYLPFFHRFVAWRISGLVNRDQ